MIGLVRALCLPLHLVLWALGGAVSLIAAAGLLICAGIGMCGNAVWEWASFPGQWAEQRLRRTRLVPSKERIVTVYARDGPG